MKTLDLQWRDRRSLCCLRPLGRSARCAGTFRLCGRRDIAGAEVIESRIDVIAPHPLATLRFEGAGFHSRSGRWAGVRIGRSHGVPGCDALDSWRRRRSVLRGGLIGRRSSARGVSEIFSAAPLGDLELTQAALADMATAVDASALLVYRAALGKGQGRAGLTSEAAMAKMHATETAQAVIDKAVQIFGGLGVTKRCESRGTLSGNTRPSDLRGCDRGAET